MQPVKNFLNNKLVHLVIIMGIGGVASSIDILDTSLKAGSIQLPASISAIGVPVIVTLGYTIASHLHEIATPLKV